MKKYDLVQNRFPYFQFPDRYGFQLGADTRSLVKIVYSHAEEIGLMDIVNNVPCPIQTDPTKYQRKTCRAVTDTNIREAIARIIEFTTFDSPRIIVVEAYSPNCAHQKARYYIDIVTGNNVYFRKGGKQDGKLWSAGHFDRPEIVDIIKDPNTIAITDLNDYKF